MNDSLFNKIMHYAQSGVYPMHMPGHKRDGALFPGLPYSIDITEIEGFDDLHNPSGVLLETAQLAAALYGSDQAFLLVNGSTAGILAAIGALAERGDRILCQEGSHRSVANAASLFGLDVVWLEALKDEASGIALGATPGSVARALAEHSGIKLVVVTSPTYEGAVSDLPAIAAAAHERGVPLLVDSAHGAHLGFSGGFPENAVKSGADAVVMSLHKTLPALTQCSLLHVRREHAPGIARMLSILQTSSPSYALMSSIDICLRLLDYASENLFTRYEELLSVFYGKMRGLSSLSLLWSDLRGAPSAAFDYDPGKIVILTKKSALCGADLAEMLRKDYLIETELARGGYVIAMTSICDTLEGYDRLASALLSIDSGL
ncbi:MAG: aminotransferase class I/II-fold pyridoxal phosphate-dependent enzyme [Oscillospiraceae bacterium]|nr:aminotransferase class I/II-fold pyridoxal phosphate-dependent enzyme [Oscillospiraceae bacterium]